MAHGTSPSCKWLQIRCLGAGAPARPTLGRRLVAGKEALALFYRPSSGIERPELPESLIRDEARRAELFPQRLCLERHEGREQHGLTRELADERGEHMIECDAPLVVGALGERP